MTPASAVARRCRLHRLRLKIAVAEIAATVSAETGIPDALILSATSRGKAPVAHARQRVMFEARQQGMSYPEIGYALGRDHSTVIRGVRAEAKRRGVSA